MGIHLYIWCQQCYECGMTELRLKIIFWSSQLLCAEAGEGGLLSPNQVHQRRSVPSQIPDAHTTWPERLGLPFCGSLMPLSSCYLAQPAAWPSGGWATAQLPRGPVTFPLKLLPVLQEMPHQPQDIVVHLVSRTSTHQSPPPTVLVP